MAYLPMLEPSLWTRAVKKEEGRSRIMMKRKKRNKTSRTMMII